MTALLGTRKRGPLSARRPLDSVLVWRRILDDASIEHATVASAPSGIALTGTVLAAERARALRVNYRLLVDSTWRSRSLRLTQEFDGERRSLTLESASDDRWLLDGLAAPQLDGCTDIDLGLSPITNALPLNRLGLVRGDTADIRAAWVRFPELTVEPARQRYERIGLSAYRYTSLTSGFTATLQVDDWSFPIEYEGVWKLIANGPATFADAPNGGLRGPVSGFAGALLADGPSPELGDAASVFGFLVGGWSASVRDIDPDGHARRGRGEWWFSWVLEGRAMQDVWISPPRIERGRRSPAGAANDRYGTTLRRFDRLGGEWKIVWINPVSGSENHLRGGRDTDGITLVGEDSGTPIRWQLTNIRPGAFTWRGYRWRDGEHDWGLEAEFELTRIAT